MKRFNFRLQRVLEIKEILEEVKRRDFLAAGYEHRKKVDALREFYGTLARYQTALHVLEKKGITAQHFNLYYRFFDALIRRIEFQKGLIETARQEMEKRREYLLGAVKERKILENLRQKKYTQYLYETDKEEQYHHDDISGSAFFQRKQDAPARLENAL